MLIGDYLGMVHGADDELGKALDDVARRHEAEYDIRTQCTLLATWSRRHVEQLAPFVSHYGETRQSEPSKLHHALFQGSRKGGLGLLRDLQDLYVMATEVHVALTILGQAAKGLDDKPLDEAVTTASKDTERQLAWILTRMKSAAPQALIAAS